MNEKLCNYFYETKKKNVNLYHLFLFFVCNKKNDKRMEQDRRVEKKRNVCVCGNCKHDLLSRTIRHLFFFFLINWAWMNAVGVESGIIIGPTNFFNSSSHSTALYTSSGLMRFRFLSRAQFPASSSTSQDKYSWTAVKKTAAAGETRMFCMTGSSERVQKKKQLRIDTPYLVC